MADDGRLDVDMHLNTDPAQRELESMLGRLSGISRFADIRPIPISEQISRENFARLNRPPPSAAETFFATHAASFATGQYGGMGNVLNAFGRDIGALGSRIGSAAGSAWNAFGTARSAAGTAIGNVGAAAWNWMSTAPERIAESRRRRALIRNGFSESQIPGVEEDRRRTRYGIRVAQSEGLDLSKYLNAASRSSSEESRDRDRAMRDEERHNRVIQQLHARGLHDIADRVSRHLDTVRQQREQNLQRYGSYKTDEELSGGGGGGGGPGGRRPQRAADATRALIAGAIGNYFTRQATEAYFATDLNPLDDNWVRQRNKRMTQAGIGGGLAGMVAAAQLLHMIPGVGNAAAIGITLAAGAAGAGAGVGLSAYTSSEERKTQLREMRFRRQNAPVRTRFDAAQRMSEFAFRQQMSMTGYAGQLKLVALQRQEAQGHVGTRRERERLRSRIERRLRAGKAPSETSLAGLEMTLDVLERNGDLKKSKFGSKIYGETLALRDRKLQEIEGFNAEERQLRARPNLSYLNAASVTDSYSAKGMAVGAQVDVQQVNRGILEELRKCVLSLKQIEDESRKVQLGGYIHGSAVQALKWKEN